MRFLLAAVLLNGAAFGQPADLILTNGKIYTLWESRPVAEAVAIREGRFVAVGSSREVAALEGPFTKKIDLRGRVAVPGLNDSHTHPIMAAMSERDGEIPVMESIADVQRYVTELAKRVPPVGVIFVPKVYATRMKERRYPTRHDLDAAAPGRVSVADNGYAAVLSSAALQKAGITRETPQPANGKILKDSSGEPTGLILGAPQLVAKMRSARAVTDEDRLWALRAMQSRYNEAGITSTIDRGQTPEGFRTYLEMKRRGELTVRTYVTYLIGAKGSTEDVRREIEAIPFVTGFGDEWVRVGSLKTVADGGILIGTAYLREPYGRNTEIYGYSDEQYRGVLSVPRENLVEMARVANRLGWQMTAHTAGGGATDALLDAYEAAHRERPITGRRFTVTHGNFPDARAIARAKALGVVFDCQPAWHHFDGQSIRGAFGPERMRDFLPLRSLLDAGVVVAGGSDHMIRLDSRKAINPYHPFFGMWMAITRKTSDGGVLGPEQAVTREEALRMWTWNGAYLSFEERAKGSVEPGKLADLTVISKDYMTCPVDEIRDIEAMLTMVGGRVVFERK